MSAKTSPSRCPSCGRKHKRTNDANRRLWLLYHLAASKLHPGGNIYSAEQFHLYFKTRFLGADDFPLPNGTVLVIPRSTAVLDVAEFNDYMTQVESDLAERGIFLEELD